MTHSDESSRSRVVARVRLIGLLCVLAIVVVYAYRDHERRRARTQWERTLYVALVVLRAGPVTDDSVRAFQGRVEALEDRLRVEMQRYRPSAWRPFRFDVLGPIDVTERPPVPESDGVPSLLKHAFDLWRYRRTVDDRAGVDRDLYDSFIYVVVHPPGGDVNFVEGTSQEGGRVGIVEVQLDGTMADFALFVAAHELFHTLGATDKYDEAGRTRVPEGLADPERTPPFPQAQVELMARNRPISPTLDAAPESLDELGVNAFTAREVGWMAAGGR